MFEELLIFEKERTNKEALGSYLAYIFLYFLIAFLIGLTLSFGIGMTYTQGTSIGFFLGILYCLILSFFILYKKKQLTNYGMLLCAIFSGMGAIFSPAIGMLLVAYLTTKPAKTGNKKEVENSR